MVEFEASIEDIVEYPEITLKYRDCEILLKKPSSVSIQYILGKRETGNAKPKFYCTTIDRRVYIEHDKSIEAE